MRRFPGTTVRLPGGEAVPLLIMLSASASTPPLVTQLAVVLVGAALVGYLCQRAGLIPSWAYLVTGALLGPYALGVVDSTELVDQLPRVLFGAELSGDQLKRMGPLFVACCRWSSPSANVSALLGRGRRAPGITGCLIALESTAVVLKLLSSKGSMDRPPAGGASRSSRTSPSS